MTAWSWVFDLRGGGRREELTQFSRFFFFLFFFFFLTTGESEINAATSGECLLVEAGGAKDGADCLFFLCAKVMSLLLSRQFDFTSTYFFITGIAGIKSVFHSFFLSIPQNCKLTKSSRDCSPYHGTLGTAAFARFAIQVALEYEIDGRQIPSNWTTGYWALGTSQPGELPAVRFPSPTSPAFATNTARPVSQTSDLYGTEVFEVNTSMAPSHSSFTSREILTRSPPSPLNRPPREGPLPHLGRHPQ